MNLAFSFAAQQGYTFDIQNADHRVGEVHALVLEGTPGGMQDGRDSQSGEMRLDFRIVLAGFEFVLLSSLTVRNLDAVHAGVQERHEWHCLLP